MNLWFFILGYGAIQSVLLVYLISTLKDESRNGTVYLSGLLIITTFIGIQSMLVNMGFRDVYPNFFVLGFSPMFLVPPLYYLFSSSVLEQYRFSFKTLLHSIPFVLSFGVQFFEISLIFKKLLFFAFAIELVIYSILSYRLLIKGKVHNIKPALSFKILTLSMVIFAIGVLLLYIAKIGFHVKTMDITSLVIVFLICFVTILEIHMMKDKAAFNFAFVQDGKYKNSNLHSQDTEMLRFNLDRLLVNDEIFLDPSLRAGMLAESLGVSRHQLTEFINQELGCSFNDLINKHRIDYLKRDLLNQEKNHLSISGLASEAGFKSTSTFYRIFKNQTGFTPSEYIKHHT